MKKGDKESAAGGVLGGTLNILGLKIDLGELLTSPGDLQDRLEELRERLKAAGGREALSDEEWRRGGARVSGHIRVRGPSGEREFHVGTLGERTGRAAPPPAPETPEPVEPPVDVFDEGEWVTIVADVPGVSLEDLDLRVQGRTFTLSSKATGRRGYRKELRLEADLEPESVKATCRNGVLEVRVHKRKRGARGTRPPPPGKVQP